MKKAHFLARLQAERQTWEDVLALIDEGYMGEQGVSGSWSVKDIIGHVAWYEEQMAAILENRALDVSDLWFRSLEERNTAIVEQNRQRPLHEVREDARRAFERLMAAIEALSEEDLTDAARFPDMPLDWVPWRAIAANSYAHYHQHLPEICHWLQTTYPLLASFLTPSKSNPG
ncbi:MAG: ClbS/DfsB family four-helix bundle protein [Chloroflexi bacterium]|nr:ClbS/DfsB family four-helix bundle protein [Chloroflexota bacterium]